jgi:hypothetical protein
MNIPITKIQNKFINCFQNKTINILLLLSLFIILILIYLKNNKIELFTSIIDNYINTQSMYVNFNEIINSQANKLKILQEDIYTVLKGETIPIRTTRTTTQSPTIIPDVKTVFANNGTVNCNTYCRGVNGSSWNNELPPEWNGAKCVGTNDPDPAGCASPNRLQREGLTCECQKDNTMAYNKDPDVKTVFANNGTVNCNTYCRGVNGSSWNNELPPEWNGAKCVGTNDPDPAGCASPNRLQREGLTCECQKDNTMAYNKDPDVKTVKTTTNLGSTTTTLPNILRFNNSKLTTKFTGIDKCLDVINDGQNSKNVELRPCDNYSGQYWTFENNKLTNNFTGIDKCLDVINDGQNSKNVELRPCDNYSGQYWTFENNKLRNNFTGIDKCLDVINDGQNSKNIELRPCDKYSVGQYWFI